MRDRYRKVNGVRTSVADLPTHIIQRDLARGPKVKEGAKVSAEDIALRLEIELIARSRGWPTKRLA